MRSSWFDRASVGSVGTIPTQYDPARGFTRSTGPIAMPASAAADRPAGDPPALQRGAKGPWVGYLQRRIGASVDADFGPKTERAVKALQASKGLPPSGQVDAATWAAAEAGTSGVVPIDAIQTLPQAINYARAGWKAAMDAAGRDAATRNAFLGAADGYRWVFDLAGWKSRIGLASSEVQDWIVNLRGALKSADIKMGATVRGVERPPLPKRDPVVPPIARRDPPPQPIIAPSPVDPVYQPDPPPPAPSDGVSGLAIAAGGFGLLGLGLLWLNARK